MSEPFVGEIRSFGFNFAPRGWAQCNGQLLPIAQNTALFSLLGTTYGGDGRSTFGLPNLSGSVAMGSGQGSGLHAARPRRNRRRERLCDPVHPADPCAQPSRQCLRGEWKSGHTRRQLLGSGCRWQQAVWRRRPGADGRRRHRKRGCSSTAFQPPAIPGAELLHRAARYLPPERLARIPIRTGAARTEETTA